MNGIKGEWRFFGHMHEAVAQQESPDRYQAYLDELDGYADEIDKGKLMPGMPENVDAVARVEALIEALSEQVVEYPGDLLLQGVLAEARIVVDALKTGTPLDRVRI